MTITAQSWVIRIKGERVGMISRTSDQDKVPNKFEAWIYPKMNFDGRLFDTYEEARVEVVRYYEALGEQDEYPSS